jgi:hypothetical protein
LLGSFPIPDSPSTWANFVEHGNAQVAVSSLLITLLILPLNLWCAMRTDREVSESPNALQQRDLRLT